MKKFLFLLGFSMLTLALTAAESPEQQAEQFFRDLKTASPSLYQRLQEQQDLFPGIMQHVVPGMIPATEKMLPDKKKTRIYPAKLISQNTIFYARIDRIDEEALQKLMEEMRTTARLANRPVGAILDLRSAENGDFESVARFVALFTPKADKPKHFFQKIPLAILCGKKTNGPAELLTILLERSQLGISIGEKSAGNVFPRKETELNGKKWLVPEIPDFAKDVPFGAHSPVITCAAYPQIPFDQIGKISIESDQAIQRATDLLRSLHAIRGK